MTYRVRIPAIFGCSEQRVTSGFPRFVKKRDLRLNLVLYIFQTKKQIGVSEFLYGFTGFFVRTKSGFFVWPSGFFVPFFCIEMDHTQNAVLLVFNGKKSP